MMNGWMRCWTSLRSACQHQALPAAARPQTAVSSQHQQQAGGLLAAASSPAQGQSSSSNSSSSEGWAYEAWLVLVTATGLLQGTNAVHMQHAGWQQQQQPRTAVALMAWEMAMRVTQASAAAVALCLAV
jgi:hypothetical protein